MRILLGMSGGLDSTYAALKLASEGHSVEGAVVLMHEHTEIDAAKTAAEGLGIPLHVINREELFCERVVDYFVSEYSSARTPNPCVVCNSDVKFRALYDYAIEHGFDMIATGHYAKINRIDTSSGVRYALSVAADSKKDQTYMLWRLPQDILSKLYLPLSDLNKEQIRKDAREHNVSAADREESQEICFIPSGDYASFIEERTSLSKRGNFIDQSGNVLGEHQGIIRYTVGQRKGLGIAMGQRVFVTNIDPVANTITLSASDSYSDTVEVTDMVFSAIAEPNPNEEIKLFVKLRYLAPRIPCTVLYRGSGVATVTLNTAQRAVTPGQSAVFYDEFGTLIAGGFISSSLQKQG